MAAIGSHWQTKKLEKKFDEGGKRPKPEIQNLRETPNPKRAPEERQRSEGGDVGGRGRADETRMNEVLKAIHHFEHPVQLG